MEETQAFRGDMTAQDDTGPEPRIKPGSWAPEPRISYLDDYNQTLVPCGMHAGVEVKLLDPGAG